MELFKIKETDKLEKDINQFFLIEELIAGELTFGGIIPIIFVRFQDLDALTKTWKEFNSYVAAEYMTLFKDEYSKWNFYIFYLSNMVVDKPLKYEIENNKFSSRKIVIENSESISKEEAEKIISEHIINDNIKTNVSNKSLTKFKKDAKLSKLIDKLSLQKKNEDELEKTLNQIENTYKDEI